VCFPTTSKIVSVYKCIKRDRHSKERDDLLPCKLGVSRSYLALCILPSTSVRIEEWWQKRNQVTRKCDKLKPRAWGPLQERQPALLVESHVV